MTNNADGKRASDDFFDFNDVPPAIDPRLSAAANVALRSAIEAGGVNQATARRKAIVSLKAACAVLGELASTYSTELCASLRALTAELQELQAGRPAGDITRPRTALSRRGDPLETIEQQARMVIAFQWLQTLGVKPREASKRVAGEAGVTFQKIEEQARYFKRDTAGRRPGVLAELWQEVETAEWETSGRNVEDATADYVISWFRRSSR